MPDAPGIDAHQTRLHARLKQADREDAVRMALYELDDQPDNADQPYGEVLRRLQRAIAHELTTLDEKGDPDGQT